MNVPDGYVHAIRLDESTVRLVHADGTRLIASRGPDGRVWVDVIRPGEPTRRIVADAVRSSAGAIARADSKPAERRVVAPTSGVLREFGVAIGDRVAPGDVVAVIEAMKMKIECRATIAGTVRLVAAELGARVDRGATLVEIEPG